MQKTAILLKLILPLLLLTSCSNRLRRQQAEEALLATKEQYRNYAHFTSDSLIRTSVNYFMEHGTAAEKSEALFYLGCVQIDLGQPDQAGCAFLQALGYGKDTDNYYILGQTCMQLSVLLSKSHCSEEEFYARKAYYYYLLGDMEIYQCDALIHIANAKRHLSDTDSCRYYLQQADNLAHSINDSLTMGYALYSHIQLLLLEEQYEEAMEGYQQLLGHYRYEIRMEDYCNMASIYAHQRQETQAENLIRQGRVFATDTELLTVFYSNVSRMYDNIGNKEQAYLYKDSLYLLSRDIIADGRRNSINAFQRDFAEQQQIQAQRIMHTHTIFLSCLFAIFLLIVILCIFEIRRQHLLASLQKQKIQSLEYKLTNVSSEYEEQLRSLKESDIVRHISDLLKANQLIGNDLLRQLFQTISYKIPAFEQRLREVYTPSKTEWQLCMLIKVGFSPSDIALITNKTPSAISAMRSRLFMKTFQKKGTPAEWDAFIGRL